MHRTTERATYHQSPTLKLDYSSLHPSNNLLHSRLPRGGRYGHRRSAAVCLGTRSTLVGMKDAFDSSALNRRSRS